MRDFTDRKNQLEDRLKELGERINRIEDDLDDPMPKDAEEQAVEREDDEVLERLGAQSAQEVQLIRAALARIEDGVYGDCMKCGEPISEERLDAVPHAALCRDCAR
ncbi:TraR/DksA family transcriptional regulator [Silicimonas algicola]|uniref:TraR/DksA family transcriptional regulator n=1 Tax=Silicimonas algicola TaxID=1826607 RepID=A0A316GCF3_9RHOB|nr:TraR/DksA C4-type zinc finger protein [Silicimonas algicola]AZQ66332.1 TraR/DksA family transcriptional regulator [Silicimonas algicola]PWK58659.1 TraR/DksA family transcriptional regulator [Silicimonas algicola]